MVCGLLVVHLRVSGLVTLGIALSAVLAAVPPVLDGVVAAALESACDLGPPLAHVGDQLLNQFALFLGDGVVVQRGLQVLVVSFAALLWRSGGDFLGYADPVVRAIPAYKVNEIAVLVLRPWSATVINHIETTRVSRCSHANLALLSEHMSRI